ncbi:serpin 7 [Anopheles sinensis]|uniref:Serpin 7 n=1 Tax=Anopheles sinensis TaxID=74873 RepID=A0A084WN69_ANOSI|nr:serpin 7 [Anopheles sinensis]
MASQVTLTCVLLLAVALPVFANAEGIDLSVGDAAFSVAYFKNSFNRSVNSVVSPIALRLTFSPLYEVTEPSTREAVRSTFFLAPEPSDVRSNAVKFVDDVEQNRYLNMSFGVFKTAEELSPELADSVRAVFKVEPQTVVFADTKSVVAKVNKWAEEATAGLIKDYLTERDIEVNQELLLLNALYLRANWAQKFPLERTSSETFEYLDGPAPVDLMSVTMQVLYKADEKFHTIQVPYSEDSDLTMWILLPHRGGTFDELIDLLSVELLDELEGSFAPREVDIFLPKFTVSYSHNPRDVLSKLGHESIFDGNNFGAFASHRSTLAGLKQSTFLKVDESGTEAAAVTSVGTKFRVRNTQFRANQPFVFIIRKISTDTILFFGHYSNREQN